MLRELAEAVEALAAMRPMVLVLEDLHWSDAATVDWLEYVARRREVARLLVLGTYRPMEARVQRHPIHQAAQELQLHGQGRELVLGYFPEAAVAAYLAQRLGTPQVPAELGRALHRRTTGNPLFLKVMVDMLTRQGRLRDAATSGAVGEELAVTVGGAPDSLRQLIEQQLLQLAPDVQALLEAASVAGQEFAVAAVAAAVTQAVEAVEDHCAALARQGQFLLACGTDAWPDGTVAERYGFLHALYRETLYARVPMGRRVRWHQQIGRRLEAGYGPQARERAAELAEHFVRGQDPTRAMQYLQYAGEQAAQRSAHQEVLRHCTQGLERLATLPETPERLQRELVFQTMRGPAFMALKGFASPEVAQVYARARELCQQLGDTPLLFPVLWGVWAFHVVHTDLHIAQPLAEQLLALAQRAHDPARLMQAHRALGQTLFRQGEFAPARTHLEQSLALADPQQHYAATLLYGQDSGVYCLSLSAEALALLGRLDQARQRVHEALRLARERAHPLSLAIVLHQAIRLYGLLRERQAIQELAEAATTLAIEHGFAAFIAGGAIMRGWLLTEQGQSTAGLSQMSQGLADYRQTGTQAAVGFYLGLLAAAYGKGNQPEAGLAVVAEALARAQQTDNRVYEQVYEAELYRLQGELLLLLAAAHPQAAAACFQQALVIARRQQAKTWELRAALSLARLWQQQGQRAAAVALLAPIYGWFTEGFDTADLQEAQALLAELGG
jgi:predicted ATPase